MRTLFTPLLFGALLACSVPCVASANTTFTTSSTYPFVSSVAVKINGDFVAPSTKTNGNVTVVVSVDAGTAPGVSYTIDGGSDSHPFTDNGSFTFTFQDNLGNTGSSTVTVDNIDRTPPIITIDPFSTTSTNQDVVVSASTTEGTLNASSHTFVDNGSFDFSATDEAGNSATTTVTISHIDRVAPVVTLLGDAQIQLIIDTAFTDPGAQALDDNDGSIAVVITGTVDTAVVGAYIRTYVATDTAGNAATSTRTIELVRRSSSSGGGGGSARTTSSVPVSLGSLATTGRVLGAATYNFTRDLAVKDKGDDVTALQDVLIAEGYLKESSTGYFGSKTQAALKLYQSAHGIRATGVLGPLTRAVLSGGGTPVATSVSGPPSVSSLQAQLAVLLAKLAALQAQVAAQGRLHVS